MPIDIDDKLNGAYMWRRMWNESMNKGEYKWAQDYEDNLMRCLRLIKENAPEIYASIKYEFRPFSDHIK